MNLLQEFRNKSKALNKNLVLPEGMDDRMLYAGERLVGEKICNVILLGNKEKIAKRAETLGVSLAGIELADPEESEKFDDYANEFYSLRKHKGITKDQAVETLKNPLFYGAMMVRNGDADASLAGAVNTTGNVMRAGIYCIGLEENIKIVSSSFLMILPEWDYPIAFADCAVVPDPDSEQLADIAIVSADTYRRLTGIEPKVAMLSFSTYGSANHPMVDKVKNATDIINEKAPHIIADGEMQLDAAIVPSIGLKKAPGSKVAGHANVLVFPDLQSGNIGYKLTQRLAKAEAVGPIVQGLAKPANDLSRGCSVEDIVNVSAICCIMAK